MDANKIAEIVAETRQLSLKYHQSVFYSDMLIHNLADELEDEKCIGPRCNDGQINYRTVMKDWDETCGYCKGTGRKPFDRAAWVSIAKGE